MQHKKTYICYRALIASLFLIFSLAGFTQTPKPFYRYVVDPDFYADGVEDSIVVHQGKIVTEQALSGSQSVEISGESPYGFTIDIFNVQRGDIYEISLFVKQGPTDVFLVMDGKWGHYQLSSTIKSQKGTWKELVIRTQIPEHVQQSTIRCYAFTTSQPNSYIDSMTVVKTYYNEQTLLPKYCCLQLLYDLYHDYHVNHRIPPSIKQLLKYARIAKNNYFYTNLGIDQAQFLRSVQHYYKTLNDRLILHDIRQFLHLNLKTTIAQKFEKGMFPQYPTAYLDQNFCFRHDSLKLHIMDLIKCKGISIYKLHGRYEAKKIRTLNKLDSTMLIPCQQFEIGAYYIALEHDGDTSFKVPFFINGNAKKEVVILAPYCTWVAYNVYGGKSFYRNMIDNDYVAFLSVKRPIMSVTFDSISTGHDVYLLYNIYNWFAEKYGANIYPDFWLESHPELFKGVKTIVLAQHAEYFTPEMYSKLLHFTKKANLISMGGNQVYWKIKWDTTYEVLECQKPGGFFSNSVIPGGQWRSKISSEAQMLGNAFNADGANTYAPYRVLNSVHWLFNGTNVSDGDLFGAEGYNHKGISGVETDKLYADSPAGIDCIAKGINPHNGGADFVFIDRNKYATLSTGSITSGYGLNYVPVYTQIIANFMNRYHK